MEEEIRIRACLAVVHEQRILLISKEKKETGEVYWSLPGGRVEFGESLSAAAIRDFKEETGFQAEVVGVLDVNENILTEKPSHSLSITYVGRLISKTPGASLENALNNGRWFSAEELKNIPYRPQTAIQKALGL